MTNEERSPEEIEREIERERAGLTNTLDALQDKFSVDTVVRQVSDQFRENGGDIARSVSRSVKDNPVALALTGVGLAWMIFGNNARRDDDDDARHYVSRRRRYQRDDFDYDDDDHREHSARRSQGLSDREFSRARPSDPSHDRTYASDNLPSWASDPAGYLDDNNGPGLTDRVRDAAGSVRDGVSSATSTTGKKVGAASKAVGDKASSAGAAIGDAASSTGSTISSAVKSASDTTRNAGAAVSSAVSDAATSASERATAMRQRLSEGTENLTDEARDRVIAAREKAIEARNSAMRQARKGGERASDLFEDQPLVAGALALAVGAAIGAALPRSRVEDDYMGAQSDQLMQDAERIFEEEKQKLTQVAGAATDEAKKIAAEVKSDADAAAKPGDTAADAVIDKVKSSAKRVADTAKSDADKRGVGKPAT